jgi:hypothetical protein
MTLLPSSDRPLLLTQVASSAAIALHDHLAAFERDWQRMLGVAGESLGEQAKNQLANAFEQCLAPCNAEVQVAATAAAAGCQLHSNMVADIGVALEHESARRRHTSAARMGALPSVSLSAFPPGHPGNVAAMVPPVHAAARNAHASSVAHSGDDEERTQDKLGVCGAQKSPQAQQPLAGAEEHAGVKSAQTVAPAAVRAVASEGQPAACSRAGAAYAAGGLSGKRARCDRDRVKACTVARPSSQAQRAAPVEVVGGPRDALPTQTANGATPAIDAGAGAGRKHQCLASPHQIKQADQQQQSVQQQAANDVAGSLPNRRSRRSPQPASGAVQHENGLSERHVAITA